MKFNRYMQFFKMIFITFLILNLSGCAILSTYRAELKFKDNGFYLKNGDRVTIFQSNNNTCGGGVRFFWLLGLVPVPLPLIYFNTCEEDFNLRIRAPKDYNILMKYNEITLSGKKVKSTFYPSGMFKMLDKEIKFDSYYEIDYIFKIENFKEFKKAKDKKLILTTEDGFKQEIPVYWKIRRNQTWWPN